ncbi:MAG TPA: S1 RNA-binding domain-containing protein [Candidatus Polarisedimenticolaceae bacterium]|nr:S1 RNA-binding domain-containing protein [Candidatus Polarisedimenticolaceae bacterium]
MFEASQKAKRIEEGDTVQGTVVALWPDVAFLDVGGKGEATIAIEELKDEDGVLEVEVGERIEAVVVSTSGGLELSRKLARGAAGQRQLQEAFRAGLPVEGKVEGPVKGGFEVRIAGQRAFCPVSQIDLARNTEPQAHEGRVYTFRILEFKEGGRDLVVSRRALLEEEQAERAEEIRQGIVPGAVLSGQVASVRDYGAFIDLGAGIQGLLHVSEMGWGRVADPSAVVKPGDTVTVKVLRVDEKTGKISLGLKQLLEDPWARVPEIYAPGQVHRGRVTRQADFGAFVELTPGVEALAHESSFPPTGKRGAWKDAVPPGTEGAFEILSVDTVKKRIGVALVPEGSVRARIAEAIVAGARLTGKVERHERYGVFVYLAPGRTGLIPMTETGLTREADLAKTFPLGADVEVDVLEVEPDGRRIRLSRKAVLEAAEKQDLRDYTQRTAPQKEGTGFGTLADKLRSALKR